jgi:mitotic checkpoint MAD2B-interacting regulator
MGLVSYSDSESSEDEGGSAPQVPPTAKQTASKPGFQKVVDSSNPRKIKVNLPNTATGAINDGAEEPERPSKRPRIGGGGLFSGLSSVLPAPKRSGDATSSAYGSTSLGSDKGRTAGSGISLKTGAAPAFSRTAPTAAEDEGSTAVQQESRNTGPVIATKLDADEVKLVGKATIFRPLSVARNNQKKKKKPITVPASSTPAIPNAKEPIPEVKESVKAKPKVSLFSFGQPEESSIPLTMAPQPEVEEAADIADDVEFEGTQETYNNLNGALVQSNGPQTLGTVASDMNLDEATRRQLFGRKGKGDAMPINLINFDTDKEYAANEVLRASGETVQHNPLRAIQPGKHTLKQLVSAATTQKEALEESWAAGKRNQREAGTRYGW